MNSLQGVKKTPDPLLLPTQHGTMPFPADQERRDFLSKKLKRQSSGNRDTSGEGSHGGKCGTVVNVSLEREK